METSTVIDVVVVVTVLLAILGGAARGFGRMVGTLAGAAGGLLLVLAVLPDQLDRLEDPSTRGVALVLATTLVVATGAAIGGVLGGLVRRGLEALRLGWLDSIAGAVAGFVTAALIWVLLASNAAALARPELTEGVRASRSLPPLVAAAPDAIRDLPPLSQALAQTRPVLAEVIGAPASPPSLPAEVSDSPEVSTALSSVVRIHGSAKGCEGQVNGSGFVVAPGRVVTNAHVVAGVDQPAVQARGQLPVTGRVVYLDPLNDLAVVAADGLDAAPLALSEDVSAGSEGVVAGYPRAGSLTVGAATVMKEQRTRVTIDGSASTRRVLPVGAVVDRGSSGGPVLETDGEVAGVIFAKAVGVERLAYAVPLSVLRPVVDDAGALVDPVDTGRCTR